MKRNSANLTKPRCDQPTQQTELDTHSKFQITVWLMTDHIWVTLRCKSYELSNVSTAGEKHVWVEARNPLGAVRVNRTAGPVYVQRAPGDLQVVAAAWQVVLGNATQLSASVSHGDDVKFDWAMGDGAKYISHGEGNRSSQALILLGYPCNPAMKFSAFSQLNYHGCWLWIEMQW